MTADRKSVPLRRLVKVAADAVHEHLCGSPPSCGEPAFRCEAARLDHDEFATAARAIRRELAAASRSPEGGATDGR